MNLFEHIIQSVYIGRIFKSLTNYSANTYNIYNYVQVHTCIPVNVAHGFTEQKDLLRWFGTPVDNNVNKFIIIKITYHFTLKS